MESINVLLKKQEFNKEYGVGVAWLLVNGFSPLDLSLKKFEGRYKNKRWDGEIFQMTAEWSEEKWKVWLGESQWHLQLAARNLYPQKAIPSFEDKVLKDAVLAMFRFIDEANARGDLFIRPYRKDDLL